MKQYSPITVIFYLIGPALIIVSHIGSLLVLITGLSAGAIAWIIFLYLIRMLATTGIYHRLLTHKSYQAPAPVLWIGSIVAAAAGQMGPSWWKAHHMAHHRHADQATDPHSPYVPTQGAEAFYRSQGGWLLSPAFFPDRLPSDVERDRVLWVIDRLHFVPMLALGAVSYTIGGLEYLGAFFLSTTLLFHGVQTVNSLAHLIGKQPFLTNDHSRNSRFVAFLTLGEGWHNLHHAFQSSSRHGITLRAGRVVYLPDPTFSFIKMLEFLKLASKLRLPAEADLLARSRIENFEELTFLPYRKAKPAVR
ncbi:acyl-CoA desaturase [Romeria aff. gracilis LEGE 07310]|uniref:Acyl-CoA desaturase n=1 Tax=Vasconcelosia minhoensis LEGE 07310 TaxID=915328 RepID=A0A8J7DBA2_9CYAN|nr:acyl-CoA desaturase [Romeria gracilis]MBE9076103.1 acyl-CoA desaturase [Romeria aff. gracilis LEGE 07310]